MEGIYDETALKDLKVQAFGLQSDSRQDFGVDAERARWAFYATLYPIANIQIFGI